MCFFDIYLRVMDPLIVKCGDGTCCCMPQRSVIVLISIISLCASILDALTNDNNNSYSCNRYPLSEVAEQVQSLKALLVTLFQMANLLLLLAAIVENTVLVQLYVWYTLGFVVMGLLITIAEFVFKFKNNFEGSYSSLEFVVEVIFLFVIFRCLPLVDAYRRQLDGESIII